MFEKFTERARKTMSMARQEAQRLNQEMIGTEHMLLALLQDEGGVAQKALRILGVDLQKVRVEIDKIVKPSTSVTARLGQLPFTPRTKRVIELAGEEACRMSSDVIDTGHLLVGLLAESEGVAADILRRIGIEMRTLRSVIADVHSQGEGSLPAAAPPAEGNFVVVHLFQKITSKFKEGRVLVVKGETYLYGQSITLHGVSPDQIGTFAAALAEKGGSDVFMVESFAPEK